MRVCREKSEGITMNRFSVLAALAALALVGAAARAHAAPAAAGGGELVFVNELVNETSMSFYSAFLVYIDGIKDPVKVDPEGRFVRVSLPAGTYTVAHLGEYDRSKNDLFQYFTQVKPFTVTVKPGERTVFPYLFIIKLLKGSTANSWIPVVEPRLLTAAESTAVAAELGKALGAGDAAVAVHPIEALVTLLGISAASVPAAAAQASVTAVAVPGAAPGTIAAGAGEVVFVNELANTSFDSYYTAWLIYLQGRTAPLKVDPSGRFVRVILPAGSYSVTRVGLYYRDTNDVMDYGNTIPPFSFVVPDAGRVLFPVLFTTKLIATADGGGYTPTMKVRVLPADELTDAVTEFAAAAAAGTTPAALSLDDVTPRLGKIVATLLPPIPLGSSAPALKQLPSRSLPSLPVTAGGVPFETFAAEQGIPRPQRYAGAPGAFLFPWIQVIDRTKRTVRLGGYLPRTGQVSVSWGDGTAVSLQDRGSSPPAADHAYAGKEMVFRVTVTWFPPGAEARSADLYADLSPSPWLPPGPSSPLIRAGVGKDLAVVVSDSVVQVVTADVDATIASGLLGGAPVEKFVTDLFGPGFDFVYVLPIHHVGDMPPGRSFNLRNDAKGIGVATFGDAAAGKPRLSSFFYSLGSLTAWPLVSHEMLHAFANFVIRTDDGGHWGFSTVNGLLGGMDPATLKDLGNGRWQAGYFRTNHNPDNAFAPLELYLMGLGPASAVKPIRVFDSPAVESTTATTLTFTAQGSHVVTLQDIVGSAGARVPAYPAAQHAFRAITLIVTDAELSPLELEPYNESLHWFGLPAPLTVSGQRNFAAMTSGRGTLRVDGLREAFRSNQP
jgi:hypothetical protein